jgi:hypothetical protein
MGERGQTVVTLRGRAEMAEARGAAGWEKWLRGYVRTAAVVPADRRREGEGLCGWFLFSLGG